MNLLFVCKYNRFRSQLAEAFFHKLNTNKKIKASSAGIFKGSPVHKNVFTFAKKYKIKLNGTPKTISSSLLNKQDLVILVADNVPRSLFTDHGEFKGKLINWKVPDIKETDKKAMKLTVNNIQKKVRDFVENHK